MPTPVIGRLRKSEWPMLLFGLFLLILETIARIIAALLPDLLLQYFDQIIKRIIKFFSSPHESDTEISAKIREAGSFDEMCEIWGYTTEEHFIKTEDDYILCLHRIVKSPKFPNLDKIQKPVAYLHHGLLMCSEVWVSNLSPKSSIAFTLADLGYDVWLGNSRGNKYSKKNIHNSSSENKFWNFSFDEMAMFDIPNAIDYILSYTNAQSLVYVGFSQGTAQAFAALSIHPSLNKKIRLFIAIAPALAPKGLINNMVDSLMKSSPFLLFLLFGRKSILGSVVFWQYLIYPPLFARIIDSSLIFLFGWYGKNISFTQKLASYFHLYSTTSVKAIVHWFQIMRTGSFQMYDDDLGASTAVYGTKFYKVARYPVKNISTRIFLIYGMSDSLVDIKAMVSELPPHTVTRGVPNYEHLDMIWADDVVETVFPYIYEALNYSISNEYPEARPRSAYLCGHSPSASLVKNPANNAVLNLNYDQIYNLFDAGNKRASNSKGNLFYQPQELAIEKLKEKITYSDEFNLDSIKDVQEETLVSSSPSSYKDFRAGLRIVNKHSNKKNSDSSLAATYAADRADGTGIILGTSPATVGVTTHGQMHFKIPTDAKK